MVGMEGGIRGSVRVGYVTSADRTFTATSAVEASAAFVTVMGAD